jgi:hypothetical protein
MTNIKKYTSSIVNIFHKRVAKERVILYKEHHVYIYKKKTKKKKKQDKCLAFFLFL